GVDFGNEGITRELRSTAQVWLQRVRRRRKIATIAILQHGRRRGAGDVGVASSIRGNGSTPVLAKPSQVSGVNQGRTSRIQFGDEPGASTVISETSRSLWLDRTDGREVSRSCTSSHVNIV